MGNFLSIVPELLRNMILTVVQSLIHNWLALSLAIITAAFLKAYVDAEKLKQSLLKKTNVSIFASVAFGALTPFCACGTMAVIIGMLTTSLPWGPVMTFLTSSPLMSPDGFVLIAGIISLKFAIALATASIVIGLGSGYLTHLIELKTDFLKNQSRFSEKPQIQACSCSGDASIIQHGGEGLVTSNIDQTASTVCGCQTETEKTEANAFRGLWNKFKGPEILESLIDLGLKQILPNFALFVAIGFLVNYFVPTKFIMTLFNAKNIFAVPLAALIGLPLYVTTESSVPLINSLLAGGASGGAMLAFMITGPATSAWVIAGISTFMKKRVISLYILYILMGGILSGYLYDLFLTIRI